MRKHLTGGALAAAMILGGCHGLNRSFSPGPEPLPIFRPELTSEEHVDAIATWSMADEASWPSLPDGHDRSGWPLVVIPVPIHGVEHWPTWELALDLHEQREFPTAVEATAVPPIGSAHVVESLVNIPLVPIGIAIAPLRMVTGDPPWEVHRSPDGWYERVPELDPPDAARWIDLEGAKPVRQPDRPEAASSH